ncbi:MAG: 4Fe-4S binding protein [Desulfobacterales bacterium]|nr:4Fe-4S binding protein [Desulfobacterales bacterium]
MAAPVYHKLAQALDAMPNGFPSTESGVELRLLEKIFTPEEADLFCDLKLKFETPEQVAERTGRPLEGLGDRLRGMWHHGQLFGIDFGTTQVYRALPWVFGVYEFQLKRLDREMAELCEAYMPVFGKQFFQNKPQLMQVVPVEKKIEAHQEAMPYEKVSELIEKGLSFGLSPCICKKEKKLLDKGCDKPLEVCLGIAPVPGVFDNHPLIPKAITKAEAYEVLRLSEEAGLVHLTSNVTEGHYFICNCCGCCCGVLRSINDLGISEAVNSAYYARIDPASCVSCGVCADERCQIGAIEQGEEAFVIKQEKCIGCGLCIPTCPSEAIQLIRKPQTEIRTPPKTEKEWFQLRGKMRA